jgi:hypothetical protein
MSLFSAHCIPVEWQTRQNCEFASSFASNVRNQQLRLVKCLKYPFRVTPWEWYWCSKTRHTSVMDFEPSDHPSSSMTDENLEKVRQTICENTRSIINDVWIFQTCHTAHLEALKSKVWTWGECCNVCSQCAEWRPETKPTSCVQRSVKARQKGQRFPF